MSPSELADRLKRLDWSATSLQHQLAVACAVETLGGPPPGSNVAARTMRHVRLLNLDGTLYATAGFLPGDPGARWDWIVENVCEDFECNPEQVGCAEPHEDEGGGDLVTVDGLPVLRVSL